MGDASSAGTHHYALPLSAVMGTAGTKINNT